MRSPRDPSRDSSPKPPRAELLIEGASEVLTCRAADGDPAGRIPGGVVAVAGGRVLAARTSEEIGRWVDVSGARRMDAAGGVVAPGFVDCHTHLVFGGSRAPEYAARLTRSSDDVEALGIPVGIRATVRMTRAASTDDLVRDGVERLAGMLAHGTTTAESKSGYGLSTEEELRLLEVNRRLANEQPVHIVSTFLGAHDFPEDVPRERYLSQIREEMIPEVAGRGLAEFCDVFCDDGYYTVDESRRILEAGLAAGMGAKIHTDQYSALGGAAMAAELAGAARGPAAGNGPGPGAGKGPGRGAGTAPAQDGPAQDGPAQDGPAGARSAVVSADHLNFAGGGSLERLAAAGVVAVGTPALDLAVRHPRPFDGRALLKAGLTLALATDLCPACYVVSMPLVVQLACRLHGLSPEEAIHAATSGGAAALGLADRGVLAAGYAADIQIWDVPSLEEMVYRIGHNPVRSVIREGRVTWPANSSETLGDIDAG